MHLYSRRFGEIRSTCSGETGDGSMVPRHGPGDGGVQDQAERHPGAIQGGHQAHVRVVSGEPWPGRAALV